MPISSRQRSIPSASILRASPSDWDECVTNVRSLISIRREDPRQVALLQEPFELCIQTWHGELLRRNVHSHHGNVSPPSRHLAATPQTSRRTQLPMGTIKPVSSATDRNSPGSRSPRSGCRQRRSASKPVRSRGLHGKKWLEVDNEFIVAQGTRSEFSIVRRRITRSCMVLT